MDARYKTGNPQIIRRMKKWIDEYYPGTRLAITEYNWGAHDDITGALAQADLLGIFGREGLDLATIWTTPQSTQPTAFAWRMFLDYDGAGGAFGETSVRAGSSDSDRLSIFAAERRDGALTVLVINKTTADMSASVAIDSFCAGGPAQVYRHSAANLAAIEPAGAIPVTNGAIAATFPRYSLTLSVVPPASQETR